MPASSRAPGCRWCAAPHVVHRRRGDRANLRAGDHDDHDRAGARRRRCADDRRVAAENRTRGVARATRSWSVISAAVQGINAAGGVNGQHVEVAWWTRGTRAASDAMTSLGRRRGRRRRHRPGIVGGRAGDVGDLVAPAILTCSPTATRSPSTTSRTAGLFVRTAPSDTLQAEAIAEVRADRRGYGARRLPRRRVRPTVAGRRSPRWRRAARRPGADAVRGPTTTLVDEAIERSRTAGRRGHRDRRRRDGRGCWPPARSRGRAGEEPPRSSSTTPCADRGADQVAELAPACGRGIVGLAPGDVQRLRGEPPGAYATNAVDCVNLIALAAAQAESTIRQQIAAADQPTSATAARRAGTSPSAWRSSTSGRNSTTTAPPARSSSTSTATRCVPASTLDVRRLGRRRADSTSAQPPSVPAQRTRRHRPDAVERCPRRSAR